MARDKGLLSDLQLRHWIKAGTPLAKADGNGLTFTLSTAGVAGWILRYRHGGRRRELTIGRYPDISLADARGIATIKRAEIMQGRNPAADKQKAKATAAKDWTVRELVKDYRAKKLLSLAHSTQVSYGRHLKRVEKKLGALTVREIEASCIDESFPGQDLDDDWPSYSGISKIADGPVPIVCAVKSTVATYTLVFRRARALQRELGKGGRFPVTRRAFGAHVPNQGQVHGAGTCAEAESPCVGAAI